jgi:hypothetical protein
VFLGAASFIESEMAKFKQLDNPIPRRQDGGDYIFKNMDQMRSHTSAYQVLNGPKILPLGVHIFPFKLAGLIGVEVALRTSRTFMAVNAIIDPTLFILGSLSG